tara:strand:+ start:596 stop:868 length:273 start_codon:yes stop_codon:yes gene_type:complete
MINPLNVIEERESNFIPEHYTVVPIPTKYEYDIPNTNHVRWWVYKNLDGRFGLNNSKSGDYQNKVNIGFEDPSEATYFSMAYSGKDEEEY